MVLKNLTKEQWLNIIPCLIYDKLNNKSYRVESISNEGIYYRAYVKYLNDDDFGPLYSKSYSPGLLKFSEITSNFILADPVTNKQEKWLEEHNLMHSNMTKQEAWYIMNKAINENKAKIEAYNKQEIERYVSRKLDNLLDADETMDQCGGYYDD